MCLILLKNWIIFLTNFKPLRLSHPAKLDLQRIATYTEEEWGVTQKEAYINLIRKSFNILSTVGNIGKKRNEIAIGLYSFSLKRHTVYFRESEHEFIVLRVLHSRMDPESHLI